MSAILLTDTLQTLLDDRSYATIGVRPATERHRPDELLGREVTAATLLRSHNEILLDQRPNVLATVEPKLRCARIGFRHEIGWNAHRQDLCHTTMYTCRDATRQRSSPSWSKAIIRRLSPIRSVDGVSRRGRGEPGGAGEGQGEVAGPAHLTLLPPDYFNRRELPHFVGTSRFNS